MSRAVLYVGDALEVLRTLPDESVQCCVTSPPYWGLRSYGTPPQIWDGDDECEHKWGDDVRVLATNHVDQRRWQHTRNGRDEEQPLEKRVGWKRHSIGQGAWCQICGAWRGELGLEPTPQLYVKHLVRIFREVRRVLRPDATLWLNMGDCYASTGGRGEQGSTGQCAGRTAALSGGARERRNSQRPPDGLKAKDLVMMPARVALALQADGWWLRSDTIWHKPNPMPESVRDRPTRSHEYVFLLSKSRRYFYDSDAIAESLTTDPAERYPERARITGRGTQGAAAVRGNDRDKSGGFPPRKRGGKVPSGWDTGSGNHRAKKGRYTSGNKERKSEPYRRSNVGSSIPWDADDQLMRRPQYRRAVEIALKAGLTDAHFEAIRATGIADAGKSLVTTTGAGRNTEEVKRLAGEAKDALGGYYREFLLQPTRNARSVWTIATKPYPDAHFATFPPELAERCIKAGSGPGDTVLDAFGGAGTTAAVATGLGRNAIHIDLNPDYLDLAIKRIGPMFVNVKEVVA